MQLQNKSRLASQGRFHALERSHSKVIIFYCGPSCDEGKVMGANLLARRDWVVSWHFFELARLRHGRIHLLNRPGQGAAAQRGHGQPA
jgi:hypothetical protein